MKWFPLIPAVCFLVWIIQTTNSRSDCIILQQRLDFDSFCFVLIRRRAFLNLTKKFSCWKVRLALASEGCFLFGLESSKRQTALCKGPLFNIRKFVFGSFDVFYFWSLVSLWNVLSFKACFVFWFESSLWQTAGLTVSFLQQREDFDCFDSKGVDSFWFVDEVSYHWIFARSHSSIKVHFLLPHRVFTSFPHKNRLQPVHIDFFSTNSSTIQFDNEKNSFLLPRLPHERRGWSFPSWLRSNITNTTFRTRTLSSTLTERDWQTAQLLYLSNRLSSHHRTQSQGNINQPFDPTSHPLNDSRTLPTSFWFNSHTFLNSMKKMVLCSTRPRYKVSRICLQPLSRFSVSFFEILCLVSSWSWHLLQTLSSNEVEHGPTLKNCSQHQFVGASKRPRIAKIQMAHDFASDIAIHWFNANPNTMFCSIIALFF